MDDKIKETISAKYVFTAPEREEFGQRLAKKVEERSIVDDEFKSIKKQWTLKLENIENDINSFAQKISSGYEYRPTDVFVTFDPKNRKKYFTRCSDGTPAGDDEMSASDFQMNFPDPAVENAENLVSVAESYDTAAAKTETDSPVETPDEAVPEEPAAKKGVKSRKKKEVSSENIFD